MERFLIRRSNRATGDTWVGDNIYDRRDVIAGVVEELNEMVPTVEHSIVEMGDE